MPVAERDIALRAFSSPEWARSVDALFQATGVSVNAMDFERCENVGNAQPCAYCHLSSEVGGVGPLNCFDTCPDADAGPGRVVCRAGLAALYAPVKRSGRVLSHIVVSGFVTSTRERRGLYEHLLARGVTEDGARRAIKALPVVSRRQAESYLEIALSTATTLVEATAEKMSASERVEELRLFVSAGQQVVTTDRLDADALGGIAEEAVALIGGDAGAILRPRGNSLEVVARTEGWRGPLGAFVPRASTASGRAVDTRRTVVSRGGGPNATLAMPLAVGGRVLGVLEARVAPERLPLPTDRLARLNRFGEFIAIALEREDERAQVERAMHGYVQLNNLAAALGGQTDVLSVADIVSSVIEKSFAFGVAGVTVSGWGRDRADIVVSGSVARADVDHVLEVVTGRDQDLQAFDSVRMITHLGDLDATEPAEDWAILAVPLSYGELNVGYLFVARSDGERFGRQDNALMQGIAAHAGAALGRAALFARIRDDYAKTIAALSATLDFGERAPNGHAGRVMDYAMAMGEQLAVGFEALEQLRFAGLLHDIGKTGVPEEILLKPTPLTPEEYAEVQRHAEIGASIVDEIEFLKSLTPIILHHHERWDGKGYPAGLAGEEIPLLARVLAVADAFDAMTSERSYKERLTIEQARLELEANAGTHFDPRVIAALFDVLDQMALAGSTGLIRVRHLPGPTLPA